MLQKYLDILEVDRRVTLNELKRAYRKRSKELHPDRNPAPDAHERFVELNEAYQYLTGIKTGKFKTATKTTQRKSQTRPARPKARPQASWEEEREKVRQRARKYAEMRYEAFLNSDYFKNAAAANVIIDFVTYLGTAFTTIGLPWIAYNYHGNTGLIFGGIGAFLFLGFWIKMLLLIDHKEVFRELIPSLIRISKYRNFQALILFFVNLYLVLRIGFSTLINIWVLLGFLAIGIGLALMLSKRSPRKMHWKIAAFGVGPGVVNLFFLLNFLFSFNPVLESYDYQLGMSEWMGDYNYYHSEDWDYTTLLHFPDGQYEEYIGMRIFFDFEGVVNHSHVNYVIADGLFGFRVVRNYHLE